ncbi:sugar phosphate nucleotidyltransferase [Candidatus Pelagibacter communis]|uniref:sugar phosphate nucleotidyltransferase n=1 Tax=Pelagibacter ubique TaxID=198252 RepID=UPI00094DDAD2|nr:sugar phosphate nucleotidyltransferase [Candidatus Pelagibacter ubique]|tara:strand:- start:304 stop:990 length:687 start_codon:yes stop_codon:yes gene_type:complete
MKINTALVLCAGFGKRLNPLTLQIPKPLLKIKDQTLLDRCINLINSLDIKKILINSYYLKDQIIQYVKNQSYDLEVKVIDEGINILNTGGGIVNLINNVQEENFLVLNPDTVWEKKYINEIKSMTDYYFANQLENILLLVNKKFSFDKSLEGDFGLENNSINQKNKNFIYTGCQILNKSIFKSEKNDIFPINKIWFNLIKNKKLNGFESKLNFYHVTNLEIFKKLQDL